VRADEEPEAACFTCLACDGRTVGSFGVFWCISGLGGEASLLPGVNRRGGRRCGGRSSDTGGVTCPRTESGSSWRNAPRSIGKSRRALGVVWQAHRIEQYLSSEWVVDPAGPRGPWVRKLWGLGPGRVGRCFEWVVPAGQSAGTYRFIVPVKSTVLAPRGSLCSGSGNE
jgi:hypothetical protein